MFARRREMNERQAWEQGAARIERLMAEAEVARQVRGARHRSTTGGTRQQAAALTRNLATKLGRLADQLDGRRHTIST
jgi:hypothetical protein